MENRDGVRITDTQCIINFVPVTIFCCYDQRKYYFNL